MIGVLVQEPRRVNVRGDSYEYEYFELVVLDLDAISGTERCTLMEFLPIRTVMGDLNGRGVGDVGVVCSSGENSAGESEIRLYDGSIDVFQRHYIDGDYLDIKFLFASNADTPFAEQVARAALQFLEVPPGLSVWDAVVLKDWHGDDFRQIGRQESQGLSSQQGEIALS